MFQGYRPVTISLFHTNLIYRSTRSRKVRKNETIPDFKMINIKIINNKISEKKRAFISI